MGGNEILEYSLSMEEMREGYSPTRSDFKYISICLGEQEPSLFLQSQRPVKELYHEKCASKGLLLSEAGSIHLSHAKSTCLF